MKPCPAQLRERSVRMVREPAREQASEWAAMCSVAAKVGCTAETLRQRVRQAERDRGERCGGERYGGERGGLTSEERLRLKALERENRELRQANAQAVTLRMVAAGASSLMTGSAVMLDGGWTAD